MEAASFVASYVLSILTLIGLIVAILFYFQQNRILQNKSEIENFYNLYEFLNKNKYQENYNDFEEYVHKRIPNLLKDLFSMNIEDVQVHAAELYKIIGLAAKQYNNNMINKDLFDHCFKTHFCWLWLVLKPNLMPNYVERFKIGSDYPMPDGSKYFESEIKVFIVDINLHELKKYAQKHKTCCNEIIKAREPKVTITSG